MSKGHGAIQRALIRTFNAEPDAAFTTEELCRKVYGIAEPQKAHRVAVLRAMRGINKWRPAWGTCSRGTSLVWYDRTRLAAYVAATKGRHYRRGADLNEDAYDDLTIAAARAEVAGDHTRAAELASQVEAASLASFERSMARLAALADAR